MSVKRDATNTHNTTQDFNMRITHKRSEGKLSQDFLEKPTNGTELIAPTTVEANQTATTAPPPYRITVVLFSTASH